MATPPTGLSNFAVKANSQLLTGFKGPKRVDISHQGP